MDIEKKSYLYIQDCIDAMLLAIEKTNGKVNIFNLGTMNIVKSMIQLGGYLIT